METSSLFTDGKLFQTDTEKRDAYDMRMHFCGPNAAVFFLTKTFSSAFILLPPNLPPSFHTLFWHCHISLPSLLDLFLFSSSLVNNILCEALEKSRKFHVIVVDSRPRLEGREALRRLVQRGISCTYVLISAVSYILPEVIMKLLKFEHDF